MSVFDELPVLHLKARGVLKTKTPKTPKTPELENEDPFYTFNKRQ